MLYAYLYLGRHTSGFSAYNALQSRLMRRYLRAGGTLDGWCTRYASAFRARYGWMMDAAAVGSSSELRDAA